MNLTKSIKQGIEIIKLNKTTIEKVAKDKKATTAGILILIIGGFISGISSKNLIVLSVSPIVVLIFSFIGIGILHLIAKLFKGKAEFMEFYRVSTHASILSWLSILYLIPYLQAMVSIASFIWGIIMNFVMIKNVYKLNTLRTVFVIIIPIILFIVIMVVLF